MKLCFFDRVLGLMPPNLKPLSLCLLEYDHNSKCSSIQSCFSTQINLPENKGTFKFCLMMRDTGNQLNESYQSCDNNSCKIRKIQGFHLVLIKVIFFRQVVKIDSRKNSLCNFINETDPFCALQVKSIYRGKQVFTISKYME